MPEKLTPRQELFVNHYLVDFNATNAAIKAGYSPHTAQEQGSRLLTLERIKRAVDAAKAKAVRKVEVTVEKVLNDLEEARKSALDDKQYSSAVRASELQGKYLKMFFDGHAMEATGLQAKTKEELLEMLTEILGKDAAGVSPGPQAKPH